MRQSIEVILTEMALAGDVLLYFCYFPLLYPESGVVLDCIVSWSLPSFSLSYGTPLSRCYHTGCKLS